jgi:molecular chaperone GrpE
MGSQNKQETHQSNGLEAEENCMEPTDDAADGEADVDLEEKLEEAKKEAAQSYDRFLRVAAELENYKKRASRDMEELRKYATEGLLKDLLPVVDNLERAIHSANQADGSDDGIVVGIEMTLKEVEKILEKNQVKAVHAVGMPFDPVYHQAFMTEDSEEYPENTVVQEFQRGYTLHDRLLRPSMVIVSKAKSEDETDDPE